MLISIISCAVIGHVPLCLTGDVFYEYKSECTCDNYIGIRLKTCFLFRCVTVFSYHYKLYRVVGLLDYVLEL